MNFLHSGARVMCCHASGEGPHNRGTNVRREENMEFELVVLKLVHGEIIWKS